MAEKQEHGGHGADKGVVDKLNGATDAQVLNYVRELDSLNYINPSTNPRERKNLPEERINILNDAQSDLEKKIKDITGGPNAVIENKGTVDKLLDDLVSEGAHLPDAKEKPQQREQAIQDYLRQAGVDYGQLLRTAVGLKGGQKINELPDGHPLKQLVSYIASKKVEKADRERFLQTQILAIGRAKPSAVAEAFNTVAQTNLDPRYATGEESLQAYNSKLQAKAADYRATDPNPIYNKKAA